MRTSSLIYGTAEKADPATILAALKAGYRAFDTACQPQYYNEEVVGQGLKAVLDQPPQYGLSVRRDSLTVQTKFTTPAGHAPGYAPYDLSDPTDVKVRKSLRMSLSKLGLDYVDALLLHGPMPTMEETLEVWRAMERLVGTQVRSLGVCNVNIRQLQNICASALIKPCIVQNRFWPANKFDVEVRQYCSKNSIEYQAFWVLKANPGLLDGQIVGWLADKAKISREDALFLLVLSSGSEGGSGGSVSILNGTTSPERMRRTMDVVRELGDVPDVVRQGFKEEMEK